MEGRSYELKKIEWGLRYRDRTRRYYPRQLELAPSTFSFLSSSELAPTRKTRVKPATMLRT